MSSQESQEKIDAVLDAALDDLDDEDDEDEQQHEARPSTVPSSSPQQGSSGRPVQGPQPSPTGPSSEMDGIDAMMKQFLQMGDEGGDPDEFMGRFLQEMQSQIGAELGNLDSNLPTPSTGKKSSADKNQKDSSSASKKSPDKQSTAAQNESQSNKGGNKSGNNDVDQAIASLIEGMSKQSSIDDDDAGGGDFAGEDEMIKNLMGQFRDGHDDDTNADALIDGMMEQLLSKDLMYEPMKKVAEKFPDWLEQNRGNLPSQEYEQRCKQYECFRKLVNVYDSELGNTQTLMVLMQEVQEYGQPPAEIIKEIAPGLELDEDGLPKNLDGNGGMPFPGGDEDCRIM